MPRWFWIVEPETKTVEVYLLKDRKFMMIFRFPLTPYSATFFDVGEPRERGKCMNPRPVAVTPLENYELLITFRNGA